MTAYGTASKTEELLTSFIARFNALEKDIKELEKSNETLEKSNEILKGDITQMKQSNMRLEKSNEALEKDIAQIKQSHEMLEVKHEEEIQGLRRDLVKEKEVRDEIFESLRQVRLTLWTIQRLRKALRLPSLPFSSPHSIFVSYSILRAEKYYKI